MKLVVQTAAREHIESRGHCLRLAKRQGCCRGRSFSLESATDPPAVEFELIHAADGFQVFTTPGLVQPDELHLELSRRGKLRAYWNGQAWIG